LSETQNHQALVAAARNAFFRHLLAGVGIAGVLIGASLFAGVAGYHFLEGMTWTDAFVNAAMILSGMGPVTELRTTGAKLFAGCYALYSGLVLILATGIILGPFLRLVLHRFHLESKSRAE
jgi:hypothetical protein